MFGEREPLRLVKTGGETASRATGTGEQHETTLAQIETLLSNEETVPKAKALIIEMNQKQNLDELLGKAE